MAASIVIQRPHSARLLILLFHGVGGTAGSMEPLGKWIAEQHPEAFVVSVPGATPSTQGMGSEWFSVRGITEQNRAARISEAMPAFLATVQEWQKRSGISALSTVLIGFSQGAIMALEASLLPDAIAAQVVSIAGRFAHPPQTAPATTRIDLVHGLLDPVIDPQLSVAAAEQLKARGAAVRLTLLPQSSHGIDQQVAATVIDLLDLLPSSIPP